MKAITSIYEAGAAATRLRYCATNQERNPMMSVPQTPSRLEDSMMSPDRYPVGLEMNISYPNFQVSLTLLSVTRLKFEIKEGPLARIESVDIHVVPLGNSMFAVGWQEKDGATVSNVQDCDRSLIHSHATLPAGQFLRMTGSFVVTRPPERVMKDRPLRNKALVLGAMKSYFQQHDASAVPRHYAPHYIQHNPSIPQGRDALQALVAGLSPDVFYEPGLIVTEGNLVAIHGRIRGWADEPQVVVDLFRIEDGKLAEHWDVLQTEVPKAAPLGGISMFDPEERSASRSTLTFPSGGAAAIDRAMPPYGSTSPSIVESR